jgi:hypothetical protein
MFRKFDKVQSSPSGKYTAIVIGPEIENEYGDYFEVLDDSSKLNEKASTVYLRTRTRTGEWLRCTDAATE